MTLDNKDKLTELIITLNQAKAVYHAFDNCFVSQTKEQVLLDISSQLENYQSLASVLSDLIYKANEQAEELDIETDKETIRAV